LSKLILASKSAIRAKLLKSAGLDISVQPAKIDERDVEAPLLESDMSPADIAEILAIAKAESVSQANPSIITIGSDQTLSFRGELMHKPENMEEARRRLLALSGNTHELNSAVCIVRDGTVLWSTVETAVIRFRELSPGFIGRHLAHVGDVALTSVGAYQVEGEGLQLIERIEGDMFTVMGLPMLSLLDQLRKLEAIDG